MITRIESDGFIIGNPLHQFAENKLKKILNFNPISVHLLLKESDGKYNNKKAEINVKIGNSDFYAENISDTFENSINGVISKVKKQIIKSKEKKAG